MSSIRRICVFPWESPSYCARVAAERSSSVRATEYGAGVVDSSIVRSGTDSPPTKRSIPDPLGEIPHNLTQDEVEAAEQKLQAARDYATQVGVRGLGLAGVPQLALTVTYADLVRGPFVASTSPKHDSQWDSDRSYSRDSLDDPFNTPIWEVPVLGGIDSIAPEQSELESASPSPSDAGSFEAESVETEIEEQTSLSATGFGLSLGGMSSSRTLSNLAQLADVVGAKDYPETHPSKSNGRKQVPGFPIKSSTRPVYSSDQWEAMHPNHHSSNVFRHAMIRMYPGWRAPKTDAAAQPWVSPIPEVVDEHEHDKFVTIDRPDWHIPLFVKHSIPDPLGEIPNWYTQEQVDEMEAKITRLREAAVRRGVPGLGLGGIPELTYTIPMAVLEQGCKPARIDNGLACGGWGYRFPDLPRTPEIPASPLPVQAQLRQLCLDVGDWFAERSKTILSASGW